MLDTASEAALSRVVDQLRRLFEVDLVCIALYGSGADQDFVSGRSDLNLALVLERITAEHLRRLHPHLPKWHKLGVATPLVLDRDWLGSARDVFPMELLDLRDQHRILYGEQVFASLEIDGRQLRFQAEYEARGKLLHLRALYAEVGAQRKRLEALMLDSVKTFVAIMRCVLRLRHVAVPHGAAAVVLQVEEQCGVALSTMRRLIEARRGSQPLPRPLEVLFENYLDEVERLVDVVDQIEP
jgi:hypothetical protein